ncbi:MAG: iron ABC transporter permease [Fibrobacteria bacterium]|nr:iron ABC transporter permease [Fibrobacteria bacterium]
MRGLLLAGGVGLIAAFLASLLLGSSSLPVAQAWQALWGGPSGTTLEAGIVWQIRMPRTVVVALVGAALAGCGAALQALFRNPMADPAVLGISSGGALAAVVVLFHFPFAPLWVLPAAAFAGGFLVAILLLVLSGIGGRPTLTITLLTGIILTSLCSSGVSFALLLSDEYQLRQLVFWLSGGAEARSWNHVWMGGPFMLLGVGLLWSRSRWLDALALGEDHAQAVGIDVGNARLWVLAGTALSTGAAVSVCGPVGFVGLMVPHLVRPFSGGSMSGLIPASSLGGALLLVLADVGARTFLPSGIQLGVLTSLLGAPFFLWLLVRARRAAL